MRLKSAVAAVIGALFIVGAVTGTTLALWQDEATLDAGALGSGTISLTGADGSSVSVSFGTASALPLGSGGSAGGPVTASNAPLLKNSTPPNSKNMRMRVFLDQVSAGPELVNKIQVAALGVAATTPDCSGVAFADQDFRDPGAYTAWEMTQSALSAGQSVRICVSTRVKAGVADAGGKSGSLSFIFRGQQVRP
ncbi:MAG: hypothetical protein ACTHKG_05435 [Nocardioides sp.]